MDNYYDMPKYSERDYTTWIVALAEERARADAAESLIETAMSSRRAMTDRAHAAEAALAQRDEQIAKYEAAIDRVAAYVAMDLTEPDEDGERLARVLYPRKIRALLGDVVERDDVDESPSTVTRPEPQDCGGAHEANDNPDGSCSVCCPSVTLEDETRCEHGKTYRHALYRSNPDGSLNYCPGPSPAATPADEAQHTAGCEAWRGNGCTCPVGQADTRESNE